MCHPKLGSKLARNAIRSNSPRVEFLYASKCWSKQTRNRYLLNGQTCAQSEFQGAPFGRLEVPDSAPRALATRPPCVRNGRGAEGSERSEVEWQGMSELWRACVVKMSSIGWSSPRGLGRSRLTSGARRRTMVFETHATCATATMEDAAPERGRAVCGSWIERLCPPRAAQCRPMPRRIITGTAGGCR